MSLLYEVYLHPTKGAWGVAIKDQTVHSVMVNESSFVDAELPAHKFAGEISKRLRMGYTKTPRAKYLKVIKGLDGKMQGSFVEQHPELTVQGGLVLFTTVSKSDDLLALSQQWEELVEKTDARPDEIASWVKEVQGATQYIVAPATHPAIALVLADWAIENKRLLVAGAEGIGVGGRVSDDGGVDGVGGGGLTELVQRVLQVEVESVVDEVVVFTVAVDALEQVGGGWHLVGEPRGGGLGLGAGGGLAGCGEQRQGGGDGDGRGGDARAMQ